MNQLTLDTQKAIKKLPRDNSDVLTQLMDMAIEGIVVALQKHPRFPEHLFMSRNRGLKDARDWAHERITNELMHYRELCDNPEKCNAESVHQEEWYEFLEAVLHKDREAALKELAQVIQVCLRIGIHLDHYLGLEDHREQTDRKIQAPK